MTKNKNAVIKVKKAKKECHMEVHPDHSKEGIRLKRVKGQLEGVLKMIEERR